MFFVNKCKESFVHKVNEVKNINSDVFMIWDEKFITEVFGTGNKSFLCEGYGIHDSPVLAIIHADNMNDAVKLRDLYYKDRIKTNSINFISLYEVKN